MVVINDRTLEDGKVRVSQQDVGFFFDEETGETGESTMQQEW